jgi:hypothetical protein
MVPQYQFYTLLTVDKKIACNLESTRLTALDAPTTSGPKPTATTSPFFKSPPAPRATSKPTTPKSAVARFDQTRARRQVQQQSHRKQALKALCDSDTSSNEEDEESAASSSDASWKGSASAASSSDSEEASPLVPVSKPKGRARTRRAKRDDSDKENASEESDDELNGTLSRKFLNLLDSCEYRAKPRIPATPDPVKEIS